MTQRCFCLLSCLASALPQDLQPSRGLCFLPAFSPRHCIFPPSPKAQQAEPTVWGWKPERPHLSNHGCRSPGKQISTDMRFPAPLLQRARRTAHRCWRSTNSSSAFCSFLQLHGPRSRQKKQVWEGWKHHRGLITSQPLGGFALSS